MSVLNKIFQIGFREKLLELGYSPKIIERIIAQNPHSIEVMLQSKPLTVYRGMAGGPNELNLERKLNPKEIGITSSDRGIADGEIHVTTDLAIAKKYMNERLHEGNGKKMNFGTVIEYEIPDQIYKNGLKEVIDRKSNTGIIWIEDMQSYSLFAKNIGTVDLRPYRMNGYTETTIAEKYKKATQLDWKEYNP